MNEKEKAKSFDVLCEHVSPFINLTYVIDDGGELLLNFAFHPQSNEYIVGIDNTGSSKQVVINDIDDISCLADKLHEFIDLAENVRSNYYSLN